MEKVSRRFYGWLAFFAFFGLVLSFLLTAFNVDPVVIKDQTLFHQDTAPIRIIGFFSYFTIWSNILAGIICLRLWRSNAKSRTLETLATSALIMITVTGLVYNAVLLPAYPPKGWYWLTSSILHVIVPLGYNYAWIKSRPHYFFSVKQSLNILLIPIIYLTYTTIRGRVIKQWPYKFLDMTSEGFVAWLIGVLIIFGFGVGLIAIYSSFNRKANAKN